MTSQHHTKEFFDLIRAIGETKSKQEEDKIIIREIATLKTNVQNPKVTLKLMKEYIIRLLYCEMLGHDSSFGYIHAIKLTSSNNVIEKKVGYLAITLCLPKNHELILLIIANLQKDLKSTNFLEVAAALSAASKIVNEETIPALLSTVADLRKHQNALIRKKAVMLLHTFHTICPGSVPLLLEYAKEALCDRDPSVMAVSLHIFNELLSDEELVNSSIKDLTLSFVKILKQIIEHRLSREYDYHRIPAPWIQIKLLRILAVLGKDDKNTSEIMYDILREVMTRNDNGLNIGHAVVFEAVRTITSIYQNPLLLENAASAISRFITSSNHNLKYLGVLALTEIVKINAKYAQQHQMVVIDCLEDNDETLRRVTLSLLFTMTNSNNVMVIAKKLLAFTKKAMDDHMRGELINRIAYIAETYAPDPLWYIDTMNSLFDIGPEHIPQNAIQNMLAVIAEGTGKDEDADKELRIYCVDTFFEITENKMVLHDLHIQMIAWILGEYGYLSDKYSQERIIEQLCEIGERQLEHDETRGWIVSAILKLTAQIGSFLPCAQELISKFENSKNVDLQQRCKEFSAFLQLNNNQLISDVLPLDGSCEEIEVDEDLKFLNGFVQQAKQFGAREYIPEEQRATVLEQLPEFVRPQGLKFKEYDAPSSNKGNPMYSETSFTLPSQSASYSSTYQSDHGLDSTLLKNVNRKWYEDDENDQSVSLPNSSSPFGNQTEQQPQQQYMTSTSNPMPASSYNSSPIGFNQGNTASEVSSTYSSTQQNNTKADNPKISKKKQQWANDLFGSGNSSAKPERKRRTSKTKIHSDPSPSFDWSQQKQQQQQQISAVETDLGFSLSQPSNNLPQGSSNIIKPHPQQAKQDDLLLMFDEVPASKPSGSNNNNFKPSPLPSVDSIFQDDQNAPLNIISDQESSAFDFVQSGASPTVSSPLYKSGSLLQKLTQQYAGIPTSVGLLKDGLVSLTAHKVLTPNSLILAIVFATERGFTLSSINMQVQPPSGFKVTFDEIESVAPAKTILGSTPSVSISKLDPGAPITVSLVLTPTSMSFGSQLLGTLSYTDDKRQNKFNNFTVPINVSDFLQPENAKASDFAQMWKGYTAEKKIQIRGMFDVNNFSNRLRNEMRINVIQTIDNEIIALGRILNQHTLLHSAVKQGFVSITIRTKDPALSDAIGRAAVKTLQ